MYEMGMTAQVVGEMKYYKASILRLCATRWNRADNNILNSGETVTFYTFLLRPCSWKGPAKWRSWRNRGRTKQHKEKKFIDRDEQCRKEDMEGPVGDING